ncbi:Abc transporter g family member 31, partial [Globisporangium splendens]
MTALPPNGDALTARVLRDIAPPLAGLLSVGVGDSVAHAPVLTVNLWLIKGGGKRIKPALAAVAVLMQHFQTLHTSPPQTARLWSAIMKSSMMASSSTSHVDGPIAGAEVFPRVVLDFSRVKVTRELLDEIIAFLGDLRRQCTQTAVSRVGLKFTNARLRSQELTLIHEMLHRVYENDGNDGQRRFCCVDALDISDNGFHAEELRILAAILLKNGVYQLRDVALQNTIGRGLTDDGLRAFGVLISAALGIDTNAGAAARSSHPLQRLSLEGNALSARAYACICSALRYSHCGIEELDLAGTLSLQDPRDREQCWRWLAFGVFSHRPSQQTPVDAVRRIDLSSNPIFPGDVDAFLATLRDPIAVLIDPSVTDTCTTAYSGRMCVVEKGIPVYSMSVADTDADTTFWSIFNLEETTRLEILYEHGREWVAVVIPGFGIGWLRYDDSVARVEQIEPSEQVTDGDHPSARYELAMNHLSNTDVTSQALRLLLGGIGQQLCSLELRGSRFGQQLLDTIVVECVHLEKLDLEGCGLTASDMTTLLDALQGDLGRTLVSLNLNGNYLGYEGTNLLAGVLKGSVARIPELRELRLANNAIGDRGLASLYTALHVNKTLRILELDAPRGSEPVFATLIDDRVGFNAEFQDELLRVDRLPARCKLAVLSVMSTTTSSGSSTSSFVAPSARSDLDTWMVASIMDFAGHRVRRRILWRKAH